MPLALHRYKERAAAEPLPGKVGSGKATRAQAKPAKVAGGPKKTSGYMLFCSSRRQELQVGGRALPQHIACKL